MGISFRFSISLALGVIATLIFPIDSDSEDYVQVFIISTYIMTIGILTPLSLYTSKVKEIQTDVNGHDIASFTKASKFREKISGWGIVFVVAVISINLSVSIFLEGEEYISFMIKYDDLFTLGTLSLFLVLYFLVTKQCVYCSTLNGPLKTKCKECDHVLPEHLVNVFVDKQP